MVDLLVDGAVDFLGGQDASKMPDKIAANSYAAGINISVKSGSLQPRWGFERRSVSWPDGYILTPYRKRRTYQNVFEAGKYQAGAPFYISGKMHLVIVISGMIFAIDPDTFELTPIPLPDGSTLNSRAQRITWSAAGRHLILYDFPAPPVILDGFTARRSNSANMEIPTASQGAFNQNRLFVANNGAEFTGGDPVGSLAAPDAPITFQEVMTPGSPYYGQIFQLPTSDHNDPITYMGFLQVVDTSTGIGPLVVATNRAIYSYNTQNPRSAWEGGSFGTLICYNAGVVGPRAFANVNSDAFFLAADGYVRALSMSRDSQKTWSRVPLSREVENWFKFWDKDLIKFGFVGAFNNKIFFSVNPYRMAVTDFESMFPISDYAHGGMVVMELDNLTSFGESSKPTWTGLWTGVRPMDMINIENRAFIIAKDGGANRIYEINPDITYDTADSVIRPIRSRVYTKEYDFTDAFLNKELHSIDFNFDGMEGDLALDLKYKPSHSPCFLDWTEFKHYAPWRTCEMPEGCFINGYAPHVIRDLTFGAPDQDDCSPITQDYYKVFRKIQLEMTITAKNWILGDFRIKSIPRPQSGNITLCESYPPTEICACCNDDWYIPDFGGCETLVT